MRQYAERHSGVAIVCGGGPTLYSDLERAKFMRPDHTLLGVNFSASIIDGIRHVWTQHIEIAGRIKRQCPGVSVHSRPRAFQTKPGGGIWITGVTRSQEDEVDYLWPDLGWVAGSSGFAAALWARHGMGFDEVILAGVPLNIETRTYAPDYEAAARKAQRPPQHDNDRHFASADSVMHWWDCIRSFKEQGKTAGIYSMSGETRKILGEPRHVDSAVALQAA